MANKVYRFQGKARWAKVQAPDEKYNIYSIEVKLDDQGLETLKDTGLSLSPSKDGEGYYKFTRKPDQLVWKDEMQVQAGAPVVLDSGGSPITDLIGNGSDVTIEITVYLWDNKYGRGIGHRLEAVRVDTLVEYTPGNVDRLATGY